tara:strand:+ start:90 stop:299 length:210 start_codon:yes stop_codon:yes gene_type:complete
MKETLVKTETLDRIVNLMVGTRGQVMLDLWTLVARVGNEDAIYVHQKIGELGHQDVLIEALTNPISVES